MEQAFNHYRPHRLHIQGRAAQMMLTCQEPAYLAYLEMMAEHGHRDIALDYTAWAFAQFVLEIN